MLVPALLMLLGLVIYKKAIEPRRARQTSGGKPVRAKAETKGRIKAKARPMATGSGRPGSVL